MNERKYSTKYSLILAVEGLRRQKEDNVMLLVALTLWTNIQKVHACSGISANIDLDSKVQQTLLQDAKTDKAGSLHLQSIVKKLKINEMCFNNYIYKLLSDSR